MKERYKNRIELLQGTLDFMILQALRWGPQHGFGISTVIRTNSREASQVRARRAGFARGEPGRRLRVTDGLRSAAMIIATLP